MERALLTESTTRNTGKPPVILTVNFTGTLQGALDIAGIVEAREFENNLTRSTSGAFVYAVMCPRLCGRQSTGTFGQRYPAQRLVLVAPVVTIKTGITLQLRPNASAVSAAKPIFRTSVRIKSN